MVPAALHRRNVGNINNSYHMQEEASRPSLFSRAAALVATLTLVAALAFGFCVVHDGDSQAYATIYPAGENAQVEDQANEGDEPDANASEAETIDEEDNPLSSGLGGGEPVVNGIGFGPIAIAGIAVVALFFFVLMRRLNSNIKDMSRMFK